MKFRFLFVFALVALLVQFGCARSNDLTRTGEANGRSRVETSSTSSSGAKSALEVKNVPTAELPASPDAVGYVMLGKELYGKDRDNEAAVAFKQALELEPNQPEAAFHLALTESALGRKDEADKHFAQAVKAYEQAARRQPKDAATQLGLAAALAKTGEHQKAVDAYKRALRLDEDLADAIVYYELGNSYNKLARYKEALEAFQQSVKLDPDYYRAAEAVDKARDDLQRQKSRIESVKKQLERTQKKPNPNANNNNTNTNRNANRDTLNRNNANRARNSNL